MKTIRFSTARETLGTLGETTDAWSAEDCKRELRVRLDRLAADVAADDTDIQDGHPRFWDHCTLMAIYGDMGHQDRVDSMGTDLAQANAVEREAINALRAHLAL